MKKLPGLIVGPLLCASSLVLLSLSACGTDVQFSGAEAQKRLTLDSSTSVWINEFHYDNAGSDVAEGVEIAGEAGTDLSGYSIVLYNGSSSSGASYKTEELSGVIPDEGAGSGALWFAISGIQNGGPDGVAFVGPSGLLQFLSYEGTFTGVGGVADGITSTEIPVAETSSTAEGLSMQLTGTASAYALGLGVSKAGSFRLLSWASRGCERWKTEVRQPDFNVSSLRLPSDLAGG